VPIDILVEIAGGHDLHVRKPGFRFADNFARLCINALKKKKYENNMWFLLLVS
jgi:hypothetical protein